MKYIKIYTCVIIMSVVFLVNSTVFNNDGLSHLPEDCGTTKVQTISSRIINGEEADYGMLPWMARLGSAKGNPEGQPYFFCGGSLINRYYVLTAAHCKDTYFNLVRLGEIDANMDRICQISGMCAPPPQDKKVKRFVDPHYCLSDRHNDIGLVELREPVDFNDFVQPICLPNGRFSRKDLEEDEMLISGWGLVSSLPKKEAVSLMYMYAPLLEDCNDLYPDLLVSQMCIGFEKGKDSCNGDSGGPVTKYAKDNETIRAYVVGIVSYGMRICGQGPAVYTNVTHYTRWILDEIKTQI